MRAPTRQIAAVLLALTPGLALAACSSDAPSSAQSPTGASASVAGTGGASAGPLTTLTVADAQAALAASDLGCTSTEIDTGAPFGTAFKNATTIKCDRGADGKHVYVFVWDTVDHMNTETKTDCTLVENPNFTDAQYVVGANWNAVSGALDDLDLAAAGLGGQVTSSKEICGLQ